MTIFVVTTSSTTRTNKDPKDGPFGLVNVHTDTFTIEATHHTKVEKLVREYFAAKLPKRNALLIKGVKKLTAVIETADQSV